MAKFNLDSIKNSIGKMSLFGKKDEDFEADEEQFEEEEVYDDGYLGGEEDADRDDEEYEDEYEDAEYEDGEEYEDEEAYDEEAADEEYDDSDYAEEEGETDEEESYDDAETEYEDGEEEYDDDDEYVDEEVYGDAEEETEDEYEDQNLGYDPSLFENLDDDEEVYEEEEDGYEEEDGEYYDEDEDEELDDEEPVSIMDKIRMWLENPYVVYGLVILLPIIALIWLWFPKKYEDKKRYILSAIAVLCLIIWLIILIPGGGSNDPVIPDDPFTRVPVASPTATLAPVEPAETHVSGDNTPDPAATPTAHVVTGGDGNIDNNSFVYVTNSGVYYHLIADCGGIQNTSKITLEAATGRGLTACPDCAGGVNNNVADTPSALYATSGGKWYHSNPTCQGMTGASVVTEANAIAAKKSACPVCIGYYGTPGGKYYHNISNCSGMLGAITKTKEEWAKDGKQPCPTCIGGNANANGSIPTETQVYYTTNGTYYHTKSTCSGMKNATVGSISSAVKLGKKLCTSCVTKANTYVFATQNGTYYHTKSNCSGMKNASYITAKAAISKNKKPCPTCAKMFGTATSDSENGTTVKTNTNGSVGTVNSTNYTFVYYTDNGKYFHVKNNCSGMTNAKNASYASAVAAGKSACPTCVKSSAVTVFATTAGKYYHTDSSCSKMTNAQAVSAQTAINYGKAACPTCAYALSKGFKATKTDTATNNNNTNTNVTNNGSASAESVVYIKTGKGANNYYHTAAKCSGQSFSGGLSVTLEYALSHNYKACPTCKPASKILT